MANKSVLIRAILQKDTQTIKEILRWNADMILISYDADTGELTGPDGNVYSLSAIEEIAEKSGAIVFLPIDALTDEQLEQYQAATAAPLEQNFFNH